MNTQRRTQTGLNPVVVNHPLNNAVGTVAMSHSNAGGALVMQPSNGGISPPGTANRRYGR